MSGAGFQRPLIALSYFPYRSSLQPHKTRIDGLEIPGLSLWLCKVLFANRERNNHLMPCYSAWLGMPN